MPGSALNSMELNEAKLTEMIRLQRRTFDVAKRRQIVYEMQRYASEQAYFGANGSVKGVTAWESFLTATTTADG